MAPAKGGEAVKIKVDETIDVDVEEDLEVDVDSQLLYEYDIKTPLYSPKIHLPPGQPITRYVSTFLTSPHFSPFLIMNLNTLYPLNAHSLPSPRPLSTLSTPSTSTSQHPLTSQHSLQSTETETPSPARSHPRMRKGKPLFPPKKNLS